MFKSAGLLVSIFLVATLVSCGSYGNNNKTYTAPSPTVSGGGVVPMSLSMQDLPPTGFTVLSFQILVTGGNLLSSDTTKQPVPLVIKDADIELEHLQSEPAVLGNLSVPADTYNGATLSFDNVRMTILNRSGGPLTLGSQTCSNNQVCKLTPTLNSKTIAIQKPTAPFPLTLTANSPVGLLVHFDVNASVQGDLSVSPVVDLNLLTPRPTGELNKTHVTGSVTAINASAKSFTLQSGLGGTAVAATAGSNTTEAATLTISTDASTAFKFGDCEADNFSCLAAGQVVQAYVKLMPDGSLLAIQVNELEHVNQPSFDGTVTQVDTKNNQFQMAVKDAEWSREDDSQAQPVAVGAVLTVTVNPQATFSTDSEDVTNPDPTRLKFQSLSDMGVGQSIEIQPLLPFVVTGVSPNVAITVSTNQVRLNQSQVTGKVTAINSGATPPTFTLGSLPPLFTNIGVSAIVVEPVAKTDFDDLSGLSGLSVGNTVSVGGLLFHTATNPTMLAQRVEKR
jgi:hypothetical protein